MSYILDALRRADAERERGGVPGLHAHAQGADGHSRHGRRGGLPWAGIAVALGVTLGVILLWLVFAPAAPVTVPAAPMPEPAPPPPAVAPTPVATAPSPAPEPVPAPAVLPPQQPALPPPTPVPVARAPVAPAAAKTDPAPARAAAAPRGAASAAPEARLPALRELPEEVRRQIPNLVIGGSTWSENAASRFVILNGQLLRENDAVSPELALKQIRQRSLVLEFRGQRFELAY